MMVVDNKFEHGDIVYLITDPEQMARVVTAFTVCANGCIIYELSCGATTSRHYDFEMSLDKNLTNA
jgi:hypothetical protein